MKRLTRKLKAKLRDWLFADYRWITRAQVTGCICILRQKHRDRPLVQRVLNELEESIGCHSIKKYEKPNRTASAHNAGAGRGKPFKSKP